MTYKQVHGCAIPFSPVVANICMEVIENTAFETTPTKPKTLKRFVEGSFSVIKKTAINSFFDLLNNIDPNISFTIELEQANKMSFLAILRAGVKTIPACNAAWSGLLHILIFATPRSFFSWSSLCGQLEILNNV